MIDVRDFEKTFRVGLRRRPHVGARGISFSVEKGEIFGFLGPNGSGKTTTIKAMLGLIRPDRGELKLLGHPASSMAWRSRVGYLPEHPNFYEYLTGLELVTWFGKLSGLSTHEAQSEAKRLLERVGLSAAMNRRLRVYSKGMLQRAGVAQAMMGKPDLLILDEPMTGLDPIGRKDIRELILDLRDEGHTVFYSTHILPDVEMTCDRVAIINKGKVAQTGRLADILGETTKAVSVVISGLNEAQTKEALERHPGSTVRGDNLRVEFKAIDEARAFVASAQTQGGMLQAFEPHREDLETIFLRSLSEPSRVEKS